MSERVGSGRWRFAPRLTTVVGAAIAITCLWARPAFAADDRADAELIPLGGTIGSNTIDATNELPGEPYNCPAVYDYGDTVWYRFAIPAAGTASIRTTDDFEHAEGATGEPGFNDGYFSAVTALYPSGSNTQIGCALIPATSTHTELPDFSTIATHLGPGTYFIQVGGNYRFADPFPEEGFFHLSVDYSQDSIPGAICGKGAARGTFAAPTKRGKRRGKTRVAGVTLTCEAGSTAVVSCSRCSPKQITRTLGSSGKYAFSISGLLPRGTVIDITATKPGRVGYFARYTTRRKPGKGPAKLECMISAAGVLNACEQS